MNNDMIDLTFVLTVKGRAECSGSWIKNNVRSGYRYYVADGSLDDSNREIFEKHSCDNIIYKSYGQDKTIQDYLSKIYSSIVAAETEYVMLCDNDDFINYTGIEECIRVLNENPEFTCAGGSIYSVFENKTALHLYNLPIPFYSTTSIHNISDPFEAFKEIRKEYKYLWYAVYRKNELVRIWEKIIEFGMQDFFLLEIFQVDLALNYGKYYHIHNNHYIRLMNTSASCAASYGEAYHKRVFFDTGYREQLHRLNEFYAELYNRPVREIEIHQESFYMWYFRQAPRIKNSFVRKFHGALIRMPFFDIRQAISALNFYSKMKKVAGLK